MIAITSSPVMARPATGNAIHRPTLSPANHRARLGKVGAIPNPEQRVPVRHHSSVFAKQGIGMRRLGEWGWCGGWMLRLGLLLACTLASHAVQFHPNQSHTFSDEDQLFKV
jgi:hypothetical protein